MPILIDRASKTPNLEISVVSESVPHLRRGAVKDFLKILYLTKRESYINWNKSLLTARFANGSYIEFFSADQEARLRGARRNILYINEANNIDFESYYQLAIRTSGDIYIDFNPTAEFWAHTQVLNEKNSELIILNYLDNEALPETIKQDIESAREKAEYSSYWANWWKVYGLGEVGSLQGVIFENWSQCDYIPEDAEYIATGLDFGFTNDPTAAVDVYRYDNELYIDEVIYHRSKINSEIAEDLKGDFKRQVIADAAEPKSIEEIRRCGVQVLPSKKGKDSINYGIDVLQNYHINVTSDSINVIRELRSYLWDTDKTGEKLNRPIDDFNHAMDALRYVAIMKLGNRATGNYLISG